MLGKRQQQIVDALAGGSFSFEALVRRISPDRAEDRRLIQSRVRQLLQRRAGGEGVTTWREP